MPSAWSGLDINACPIPVKTDVGQVDLVSRLSEGTSEKMIKWQLALSNYIEIEIDLFTAFPSPTQ
jgi:hypothetical protein